MASEKSTDEAGSRYNRSEEHTSELQSRLHLVCRLLLEKKKKIQTTRPSFQDCLSKVSLICITLLYQSRHKPSDFYSLSLIYTRRCSPRHPSLPSHHDC